MQHSMKAQKIERPMISTTAIPLTIGLAVMYVPTFVSLAQTLWQTDEEGHGPLILAAALWMFYELSRNVNLKTSNDKAPTSGAIVLSIGLIAYLVGRSQGISIFEIASLIPTLCGTIAILYGWSVVKIFRFPLFFLIFMAPVPGFIIDALTGPLKLFISTQAESILYTLGYPVARMGVALSVGQYQLLVADACSGLNSMVSLIAVGLFFMHLVNRNRLLHNTVLLISIPFIAIAANLVRVITICLVTYYFGDEVGQGFIHGATGVMLFAISLSLMFIVDAILVILLKDKRAAP